MYNMYPFLQVGKWTCCMFSFQGADNGNVSAVFIYLFFCLVHIVQKGQNLATKLIVALGYKLTQYLFIGGEF